MPSFLSDPALGVYLILIAFVVIAGALFARHQDRKNFVPFLVALLILLLVYATDRFFETSREEAVRKVQAMALAADTKNAEAFAAQVADRFEYQGEGPAVIKTKAEVRDSPFWGMLRQLNVHVAVWNFDPADVREIDANTIEIGFLAKGEVQGQAPVPFYIRATFSRQPDGQMRLTRFASFHPTNHSQPVDIPDMK